MSSTTSFPIDPAALPAVLAALAPAALGALVGRRRTAAALLALPVATAAFFRDPERTPDHGPGDPQLDPDLVLAPADGKVMCAGPGQVGVAPAGQWQQVSIFLSVFDVHINRTPYGGLVEEVTYRPGKWHAAYRFESATENERSEITVSRTVDGVERRVVFRQIVGLVARRVVTRVRAGELISSGQRIGLMKFGSRMDIFVPTDLELLVTAGERTVAGESVIARWPANGPGATP